MCVLFYITFWKFKWNCETSHKIINFFQQHNLMKEKHEEAKTFLLSLRKTFSSFICRTETLKSSQFLRHSFPSSFFVFFRRHGRGWNFLHCLAGSCFPGGARRSVSGPSGMHNAVYVYECTSRFGASEKCCKTCFTASEQQYQRISPRISKCHR